MPKVKEQPSQRWVFEFESALTEEGGTPTSEWPWLPEYCVIPWIDRDPALKPNPLPLVKIKRQHRFDYEDGKCYAAELSAAALKKLFFFRLR